MLTNNSETSATLARCRSGRTLARTAVSGLIFSFLMTVVVSHPATAAVFDVPAGNVAALVAAIDMANGNGEEDTINLAAGTYTLTAMDNVDPGTPIGNGLPKITSPMTIRGVGVDNTIIEEVAGLSDTRVFHIAPSGVLTLEGLSLTNGHQFTPANRGSVIVNHGTLLLDHSTVRDSNTFGSGSIFNIGTLTVKSSLISNNRDLDNGGAGGIENRGMAAIINSTIRGNLGGPGGGFFNGGTLVIMNSAVRDNISIDEPGGAIANVGVATVTNSTISGNGTDNRTDRGSIYNSTGATMHITNSTISKNIALFFGSQLVSDGITNAGTMHIAHSTISGNMIGIESVPFSILTLTHSIVADDFCVQRGPEAGTLTSLGHNLVGNGNGCPNNGPGDLIVDAGEVFASVLGPLQNTAARLKLMPCCLAVPPWTRAAQPAPTPARIPSAPTSAASHGPWMAAASA